MGGAFQASSPKTFQGAGSRWPHFFACRIGGLCPFGHGICDTLPSGGVSCCMARETCPDGRVFDHACMLAKVVAG